MKYIDADKLIERLEEMKQAEYENCGGVNSKTGALQEVQELIESLQQEQPEVDLEKNFSKAWAIHSIPKGFMQDLLGKQELLIFIYETARHFYELGLRGAADRQRAEEEEV